MTAAIVAVAVGAGIALVAVLVLAISLRSALLSAADARVADTAKAGKIAIDAATIVTLTNAFTSEKRRADALDSVLDELANDGDVDGARARVLRRWTQASADPAVAAGGDPIPVLADPAPAPAPVDPDGLHPLDS